MSWSMTIMVRPRAIDFKQLHGLQALARAHAGERLVEQQQARRGGEREPDLEPPLLAIGEFGHRQVGALGQVHELERVLDALRQPVDAADAAQQVEPERPALLGERGDGDVLAHGQPREQLVDLVALGQAELAHFGDAEAGDVAALEHDAPFGRMHLAGQHLEEGGLAGAVRADDAAQFAAPDREIDIVVGDDAAVALGQAACLQDQFAAVHGLRPARRRRERDDRRGGWPPRRWRSRHRVRIGLGRFAVPGRRR